jgi:cytochrome c oxidase subunit 2
MAVAEPRPTDAPDPSRHGAGGPSRAGVAAAVGLVVVLAALGAWLGAGPLGDSGLPDRATAEGRHVERVWQIMLGMAGGVSGVVLALLIVALVDGVRRRNGPEPKQSKGSVGLELFYTAIPLALVAIIFVIALQGTERLDADAPDDALRVDVTGFQWGWRFDYQLDDGDGPTLVGAEANQPELVLPIGRSVALRLESNDVIHSFFAPAFLTKLDVIPGRTNELVVEPERLGTFIGHCAEFCGLDHARMNFTVRIVTAEEFTSWVAEQRGAGGAR